MHGAHEAPPTPEQQQAWGRHRRVLWLTSKPSPWSFAVPAVAVAAGLLFTATSQTANGTNLRSSATDLPGLIHDESQRTAVKQREVSNLRNEIATLTENAGPGDAEVKRANASVARLGPNAGARAVKGPSLTVILDDSSLSADSLPPDVTVDDIVVHQQDVQGFVNALWRGGAEAMMIMDQRVISTSAVRCVGNTLILQGRVYSPPFVITVIGDPPALRASLDADEQVGIYKQYVNAVGLGLEVKEEGEKTFPAYEGSVELKYARADTPVAESSSPASPASPESSSPSSPASNESSSPDASATPSS